jgi:hypothetical protein
MRRRALRAGAPALALLIIASVASAAVVQQGNLRITVQSQLQPYKLPRTEKAPIAVFVSGHVATPTGETPPQLQAMTVLVNRHGLLQSRGLPTCQLHQVQPASDERALTHTQPFSTSFVITFAIRKISQGPYGTELSASLPQALGNWGFVNRIKLTLRRKYRYGGRELSYFNASCPAPRGTRAASYPLAKASFAFSEAQAVTLTVQKSCGVSE